MTSKAVATTNASRYLPATIDDNGFSFAEIVAENLGGEAPSTFDLTSIKIPTGGMTTWMVPTMEGPEVAKEVRGVIVHYQTTRAYWKRGIEDGGGNAPPDCRSLDGSIGVSGPGGPNGDGQAADCSTCPLNEFGSGVKNNGKACKEVRQLFILREGDMLPVRIPLAPMSIKPCKDYFMALTAQMRVPYYAVETAVMLEEAKNASGIKYARATFKLARSLNADEVAYVRDYRNQVKPLLGAAIEFDQRDADGVTS